MEYPHNIFWSDIPKDAKIYDLGSSWVVHMPDGRKGVVYWTGNDAGKAQNMLKMRALPKSALPAFKKALPPTALTSKPCGKWRWDGMPGETCVCGVTKSLHDRLAFHYISEEDYQKALKTAKGTDRVNLMRRAAWQLENDPVAGWPMSGTQRRIAGLRAAATRLERRLENASKVHPGLQHLR
jgi:hypothetical protein